MRVSNFSYQQQRPAFAAPFEAYSNTAPNGSSNSVGGGAKKQHRKKMSTTAFLATMAAASGAPQVPPMLMAAAAQQQQQHYPAPSTTNTNALPLPMVPMMPPQPVGCYGHYPLQGQQQQQPSQWEGLPKSNAYYHHHHEEYLLPSVTPPVQHYSAGWYFSVLNAERTMYYSLPSHLVEVTRGSDKYVRLNALHGSRTRYQFQLCVDLIQSGVCRYGARCSFIHCKDPSPFGTTAVPANISPVPYTANPLSNQSFTSSNPTMDNFSLSESTGSVNSNNSTPPPSPTPTSIHPYHAPGTKLRVYVPNSMTEYDIIDSSSIVVTEGSTFYLSGGGTQPQHCAHYYFNGMCLRGGECHFLHIDLADKGNCAGEAAADTN